MAKWCDNSRGIVLANDTIYCIGLVEYFFLHSAAVLSPNYAKKQLTEQIFVKVQWYQKKCISNSSQVC